jgi:hypothetical protein
VDKLIHTTLPLIVRNFCSLFLFQKKGRFEVSNRKYNARMMQVMKSSTVIAQNGQGVASFARSGMRASRVPNAIKRQENGMDRLMVR